MPTFEIPDGPTTVELKRSGDAKTPGPATGSVVFNVTNKSADNCDGRLSIVPSGGSKDGWFTIDGDRERAFAAGETQTATIKISAPGEAAAGDYPFQLRAVAVNDPDNDHAEGPVTAARVPPSPGTPPPPKWGLWILIGLVALALIGGGLYFAFRDGKEPPTESINTVATPAPLPPPPAPVAARMGSLEMGINRMGADLRMGETVANVQACSKLCADTERCVAMTYVFRLPGETQNGVCWIKGGVPGATQNPYMISAVKIPAEN